MAYLVKADLKTHLYGENTDEITRGDDTIVTEAISAGIAKAKSYLSRFNLTKLFDDADPGFVNDINLKNEVKSLIAWRLIQLSNPNINLELFRTAYEDAIRWFEQIQTGKADPAGWPYKDDDTATDYPEGDVVSMITNDKRNNHY